MPKQPRLFPTPASAGKKPSPSRAALYERLNRESAALILADAEHYGGEAAGLVQWARTVSERPLSAPEGRKD